MANPKRKRGARTRHTIAVIILTALPLFALGGAVVPGMVEITEAEDTAAVVANPDFEPLKVKRRPLLILRDTTSGFLPGMIDFESLDLSGPGEGMLEQMADFTFGGGHGEIVFLDDIEEFMEKILVKEMDAPEALDEEPLFDDSLFALIPYPGDVVPEYQFDDFGGSAQETAVIPEPRTASLMLMGLVALCLIRRDH